MENLIKMDDLGDPMGHLQMFFFSLCNLRKEVEDVLLAFGRLP
jgi:hypothetical protein